MCNLGHLTPPSFSFPVCDMGNTSAYFLETGAVNGTGFLAQCPVHSKHSHNCDCYYLLLFYYYYLVISVSYGRTRKHRRLAEHFEACFTQQQDRRGPGHPYALGLLSRVAQP